MDGKKEKGPKACSCSDSPVNIFYSSVQPTGLKEAIGWIYAVVIFNTNLETQTAQLILFNFKNCTYSLPFKQKDDFSYIHVFLSNI